jgi:hypothetical protein
MCHTLVLFVVKNKVLVFGDIIDSHVELYLLSESIDRGIIYIDNMVILILLLKNRVQISQIKFVPSSVECWNINTEPDLVMSIFTDLIFLIIVKFLFNEELLKVLILFLGGVVKMIVIKD